MRRAALIMLGLVLMLAGYALGVHQASRPAHAPDAAAGAGQVPNADLPGEPKTPLIRSLIHALKSVFVADPQAESQTENLLREGDEQLQSVLGENSKRLTMEANRRPPVPRIELNFGPANGCAAPSCVTSGSTQAPLPMKIQTFPPSAPK